MGKRDAIAYQPAVIIQKIKIEAARRIHRGTQPAVGSFYAMQKRQEFNRLESGFHHGHGIHKFGIGRVRPSRAFIEGREGTDFHAVGTNHVSVTPLQIDLTHRDLMPGVHSWLRQ